MLLTFLQFITFARADFYISDGIVLLLDLGTREHFMYFLVSQIP